MKYNKVKYQFYNKNSKQRMPHQFLYCVISKQWMKIKNQIQIFLGQDLLSIENEDTFDITVKSKNSFNLQYWIIICDMGALQRIILKRLPSDSIHSSVILVGQISKSQYQKFIFKRSTKPVEIAQFASQLGSKVINSELKKHTEKDKLNKSMNDLNFSGQSIQGKKNLSMSLDNNSFTVTANDSVADAYEKIQEYQRQRQRKNRQLKKRQDQSKKSIQEVEQQDQSGSESGSGSVDDENKVESQDEQSDEVQKKVKNQDQSEGDKSEQEQKQNQEKEQEQEQEQEQQEQQEQEQVQVEVEEEVEEEEEEQIKVQNYQKQEQNKIYSQQQKQKQNQEQEQEQIEKQQQKQDQAQVDVSEQQQKNEEEQVKKKQDNHQEREVALNDKNLIKQQVEIVQKIQTVQTVQAQKRDSQQQKLIQINNQTSDKGKQICDLKNQSQCSTQIITKQIYHQKQPQNPTKIEKQTERQPQRQSLIEPSTKPPAQPFKLQKQKWDKCSNLKQNEYNEFKQKSIRSIPNPKIKETTKLHQNKKKDNITTKHNSPASQLTLSLPNHKNMQIFQFQANPTGLVSAQLRFTPKTDVQREKLKKCLKLISKKENKQLKLSSQKIFSNIKNIGIRSRNLMAEESQTESEEKYKGQKMKRTLQIQQFNKIKIIWFDARAAQNYRIYEQLKVNLKKFDIQITQQVQVTEQILLQMQKNQKIQYVIVFTNTNFRKVVINQHFPYLNSKHYFIYCGNTDIAEKNVLNYSFEQPIFFTASDTSFKKELILYVKERYKTLRRMNMIISQ